MKQKEHTVVAIVQARLGSTRLPGKTMMEIAGKPAISHLMNQLGHSRRLDSIVLATTTNTIDDRLVDLARKEGWSVFRGSEDDVLDRYYQAAKQAGCSASDVVVRVTGDDILVDPEILDQVVELLLSHWPEVRYASNNLNLSFPFGADVEAFSFEALEQAWKEARDPDEREHVTPYIRKHQDRFPNVELRSLVDHSHIRIAIDYPQDMEFMRQLIERLFDDYQPPFHVRDLIRCIEKYGLRHRGV